MMSGFLPCTGAVWPFVDKREILYNTVGLGLAVLAVYELHTRPYAVTKQPPASTTNGNWITAALSLGSLIFCLHNFVADPSTLIAWSWTGYQNSSPKGPIPHLHGALTLIVQSVGLLIPILLSSTPSAISLLAHPLWFLYGGASAYVMYAYKNWLGYIGGLNLALFLMSLVPTIFLRAARAAKGNVASTYGLAFFTYCVLNLASIFTVAYAFVPGGVFLRERTDG